PPGGGLPPQAAGGDSSKPFGAARWAGGAGARRPFSPAGRCRAAAEGASAGGGRAGSQPLVFHQRLEDRQVGRKIHALGRIEGVQLVLEGGGDHPHIFFHFAADGGGVLAPHPLPGHGRVLLQHMHRVGQVIVGKAADLLRLGGGLFHHLEDGTARLFHPVHGGGKLRVRQGVVQGAEGVQLLLDAGEHLVHIPVAGVERYLPLDDLGRADHTDRSESGRSDRQGHRQRPHLVDRLRGAQRKPRGRRRIKRQGAGLFGADDLAHVRISFGTKSVASTIKPFNKNARVWAKI